MDYREAIGKTYNRLTVLRFDKEYTNCTTKAVCSCSCGEITRARIWDVVSGGTKSCGCLHSEVSAKQLGRIALKQVLPVNHTIFEHITPSVAWLLGFWAADGNAYIPDKRTPKIQYYQNDRDLIEQIKTLVKAKHKVVQSEDSFMLAYASQRQYDDLCSIFNMDVCAKSLTLRFPIIPEKVLPLFVRGYVDGDGSLCWCHGIPHLSVSSGSGVFLDGLRNVIKAQTGIVGKIHFVGRAGQLTYSGIKAKCLSSWLYLRHCDIKTKKEVIASEFSAWVPQRYRRTSLTHKMCTTFPTIIPQKEAERIYSK